MSLKYILLAKALVYFFKVELNGNMKVDIFQHLGSKFPQKVTSFQFCSEQLYPFLAVYNMKKLKANRKTYNLITNPYFIKKPLIKKKSKKQSTWAFYALQISK